MKLSIKDIHRSQKIYRDLVKLDSQIVALDKRAQCLSEKNQVVRLNLKFESVSKKPIVDEDGDLISKGHAEDFVDEYVKNIQNRMFGGFMAIAQSPSPMNKEDVFQMDLSDTEGLSIIGFLINIKKAKRQVLINELNKIGFEING